jgi:glutamate synthase (NADPH/NADH) small chain
MTLGVADSSGRRTPVETGETFLLEVDMIIKAAGQMPFKDLVDHAALQNTSGKIAVKNNATNITGVFAGGDCVNGGKEVVDAVQAGKDGAAAILEYLGIESDIIKHVKPSGLNDTITAGISLPSDEDGNKFKYHQNLQ